MKFTYLNNIHKINKDEFLKLSENQKLEIKSDILSGSVYIVKNAVQREKIRCITSKIIDKNDLTISDPPMLERIKNIHYTSEPKGGSYDALDQSWYFFPWNNDKTGLTKMVQYDSIL
tara:strand:+ start:114 stop:464 length:351 start_codon:yes stop_codon:yes gene_type:complete